MELYANFENYKALICRLKRYKELICQKKTYFKYISLIPLLRVIVLLTLLVSVPVLTRARPAISRVVGSDGRSLRTRPPRCTSREIEISQSNAPLSLFPFLPHHCFFSPFLFVAPGILDATVYVNLCYL